MKKILLSIILLYSIFISNAQTLDGFKYVYIPTLTYQNDVDDFYGVSAMLRNSFTKKGFIVISENTNINTPCLILYGKINHTVTNPGSRNFVYISFTDCNNRVVLSVEGSSWDGWNSKHMVQKSTQKAFDKINKINYKFNSSVIPNLILPEVEKTDETEQSLTAYFDTNTIDEIEGIYKSYQSDQLGYYKIGIKKYGNKYKAIIIESDLNYWKQGEVKAIFETSSIKGFYSTKWYLGNKTPFETFALMDNAALLSVEFKDSKSSEKRTNKFIKMYPSENVKASTKIDGVKATGSGFVVSKDGVIATNAHVVENADRIEIHLNTEFGSKTYAATILLKDESNDVAILKIDDDEFKGFNSLPYSILQTTEIGEDVFTIGYPLNSLMGDNYKVTNGIVSSNSGLKDDVRFIQITTPIQPGNSGGPLFNKDGNIVGLTTSKLNERAVGTSVENVNYAIKATYLINIYNMLPKKEELSTNTSLSGKDLKDQVKVLKNYVCLIKIY
jgi:S1-C subfamily serine protease